ncbi:MFS transporter [Paenibacillus sp. JX-17]|uniref:MFS transporter n=1 Tax=Paenibacillus lacisoli TaxID=3064525 RepID=A0ABT9CDA1_9BACL|nr:MFS transporter [Paenibacillus sp. JX-17]MDO7905952.1 MFS transporter [Paenibacillus sp. JX-17]
MFFMKQIITDFTTWSRNIRLFFIANMLYQIGTGMFSVLYNLYIQGLGYTDAVNGQVVSIQSLATALMFIPIGLLSDRSSRKKMLILGALFSGAALISRSLLEAKFGLLSLAVFTGLFASFFQVIAVPFLAESVSKTDRLRMFSYHAAVSLAAQVIGSMGGGSLADLLQHAGMAHLLSLRTVLIIGGAATLASFIPLLFVSEPPKKTETAPLEPEILDPTKAAHPGKLEARADFKVIAQFTVAQLLVGLGSGLVIPYLNLYFTNRFSVSLTSVGLLISLGQIMTIVSMLIGPSLAARYGQVKAVLIFQMLSLPFLLVTGFTHLIVIASIGFLFRQALMNAANPIQSAIMIDRVPDRRRGIANSMTQTAFMLGWATMGPVQAHLVTTYGSYWGYAITFSVTGLLYVASSILYYWMFREPRSSSTISGSSV